MILINEICSSGKDLYELAPNAEIVVGCMRLLGRKYELKYKNSYFFTTK